jgi:cell division protein FtsB
MASNDSKPIDKKTLKEAEATTSRINAKLAKIQRLPSRLDALRKAAERESKYSQDDEEIFNAVADSAYVQLLA